jgi:hypothetical protein
MRSLSDRGDEPFPLSVLDAQRRSEWDAQKRVQTEGIMFTGHMVVLAEVIMRHGEVDKKISCHSRKKCTMGLEKANPLSGYRSGQKLPERNKNHSSSGKPNREADKPGTRISHHKSEEASNHC